MDHRFSELVETLAPKLKALQTMHPFSNGALPRDMPKSGIYLFSEGRRHLYVGRSNNIRQRFGHHCRPSSPHNQAVFAFLLAREKTKRTIAVYKKGEGNRSWLVQRPDFLAAFLEAKARVRAMDFRFVEQSDQTRQALLEIYAAVVLETKYNDFATS
jgi:GIY-YIG catalytic domain